MENLEDTARMLAAHWLDAGKKLPDDHKDKTFLLVKSATLYHLELEQCNPDHPLLKCMSIEYDRSGEVPMPKKFEINPSAHYTNCQGMPLPRFLEMYGTDLQNAVAEEDLL